MKIRTAQPDDAQPISALIRALSQPFLLSPNGVGAEPFFESISEEAIRRYIAADNFSYLVAERGDELVGVAAMRDGKHLYHLFVQPAYQRQGIAGCLWKNLRQGALAAGNPGEFTVNASLNAVTIYQAFGFEPTSAAVEFHGIAFQPMRLVEEK